MKLGMGEWEVKQNKTKQAEKKLYPLKNHISVGKEPQENEYRLNGPET